MPVASLLLVQWMQPWTATFLPIWKCSATVLPSPRCSIRTNGQSANHKSRLRRMKAGGNLTAEFNRPSCS